LVLQHILRPHHCANVISALLQRRHFHRSIGKAGATFVEANETAKLAEALEEKSSLRYFLIQIEMRHRARRPHHVKRSVASNLISDTHIIAAARTLFLAARSQLRTGAARWQT
jgi:hypothetical protein